MGRTSLEKKGKVSYAVMYDLYVTQSLSVKAIAERLGIAQGTVYNYLVIYNIPRRPRGSRRSKATAPEVVSLAQPQIPVMENEDE